MMLAVLMSLLTCAAPQSKLEVAKETLFAAWSAAPLIPMVTFGMPTEEESKQVAEIVASIRGDVIAATAGDLSAGARQLEVPFMLGMLDGITMIASSERVETCLLHLKDLDDAVAGIAASRMWRMRLQASLIESDPKAATLAASNLRKVDHADIEDQVVLTLYEIQLAFKEHDVIRARELFQAQDEALVRIGAHHLRNPLASGYARVASIPKEMTFGWFAIATWYTDHGIDQQEVDEYLFEQLQRLPKHQLEMSLLSKENRIAALAVRIEVNDEIAAGNVEAAAEQLMQLVRDGDIHSAERILSLPEGVKIEYAKEALAIVLAHPTQTNTPIEYWYLFAATDQVQHGNHQQALEILAKIKDDSPYKQRARELEQQLRTIDVTEIIQQIKSARQMEVSSVVEQLVAKSPPKVVQELLRFCIARCHEDGIGQLHWSRPTMLVLVSHEEHLSPSMTAEAYRLVLQHDRAAVLFQQAIEADGATIQTIAGLADCQRDVDAMRSVLKNTSQSDRSAYWYWLANLRLVQWFVEDGGDRAAAIAKINRLRLVDAMLGGPQFMSKFNAICKTN